MKHYYFPLLSLTAIVVGCSQSTAPAVVSFNVWKDPSIGTEFVLNSSYTDSSSTDGISSGNSVTVYQVLDSNLTVGGKTDVTEFVGGLYVAYEANGDFSIGDSTYTYNGYEYVDGFEWVTFPIASGGTITDRPVDSIDEYGDTIIQRGSRTFVDRETLTIGGSQFQATKIALHYYDVDNSSSGRSESTENSFAWFIPEIGFFGEETVDLVSQNTDPYSPSYDHEIGTTFLSMYGKEAHGKSSTTPQSIQSNSPSLLRDILPKRFFRTK